MLLCSRNQFVTKKKKIQIVLNYANANIIKARIASDKRLKTQKSSVEENIFFNFVNSIGSFKRCLTSNLKGQNLIIVFLQSNNQITKA